MKLKLDENGHVVVVDGKPVYVSDDGKDVPFDVAGTVATISRLNGEAKKHREGKEAAESALKAFDGIDDADAARKALGIVKNLDQKKLVDAGEIDKVKAEAIKAVEEKYAPVVAERDTLRGALVSEKVGGSFARSKMIAEKLAIPADLVQARFGDAFKVEGNDLVAYDKGGNKLYSRANPGELAGFDEALEMIIEAYPYKDSILKGTGAAGSGSTGGGNGGAKGSYTRAQFDGFDPSKQADVAREVREGKATLVD